MKAITEARPTNVPAATSWLTSLWRRTLGVRASFSASCDDGRYEGLPTATTIGNGTRRIKREWRSGVQRKSRLVA
jgi:hypothetical protein